MEPILFLLRLIAGLLVILVPGALTVGLVEIRQPGRGDSTGTPGVSPRPGHHLRSALLALTWGAGIIPTLAFFLKLFLEIDVTFLTVSGTSLVYSSVAAAVLLRRGGRTAVLELLDPRHLWAACPANARKGLLAALGVGVLYFLKYDRSLAFNESCIYTTALTATGHQNPEVRLLFENIQDARLGNTGVLAGFAGLFQQFGFRILYGVCGVLLALGGWVLGGSLMPSSQQGGQRWNSPLAGAWFGLFFLPLNPLVNGIPLLDENLLALSFGVVLFAYLRTRPAWFVAGAIFALVVTMRHVLILALPATVLLVAATPLRRQALTRYLSAFVVFTLPENLHHALAPSIGSVFRFESNPQYPAFPYSLLGMDFSWQGLLNWPFHEMIVRTPGNPFPTFVRWPLHLADNLGMVLFATMLVGMVVIWRQASRAEAAFWLLWWGPVQASLAVQEAWDVPNKMGVIAIVFVSFLVWVLHGAAFALRRPRLGGGLILGLVAVTWLGAVGIRDWRPPVDARYYQVYPGERQEYTPRVEDKVKRLTDLGFFPDFAQLNRFGTFLSVRKFVELAKDLSDPTIEVTRHAWGWFPHETPPPGAPVTIELDLQRPVYGRTDLLRVVPDTELGSDDTIPTIDLVDDPGMLVIPGLQVGWDSKPVMLYSARSDDVTMLQLFFVNPAELSRDRPFADPDAIEQCKLFLLLGGLEGDCERWKTRKPSGLRVRFRVREGAVSFASTVNRSAQKVLLWKGQIEGGKVQLQEPVEPWHN